VSLVTLSSDFGTRDSYVAEMKGVLFDEGPADLRVVDLSHELAPFDVRGAALFVRAALPRFPAGTVHMVVVDPGVGSARRALVARVLGQLLVGPDNGVFSMLFDGSEEVFAVAAAALGERARSSTFHGRDVFAPLAARLATLPAPALLGTRIDDHVRLALARPEQRDEALLGEVIHVDRFGNLITNIDAATLRAFAGTSEPRIALGDTCLRGVRDHYAEVQPGELLALIGSAGLLEVAVREGSARERLGVELGASLRIDR
jgi:S-adenosylmethionine hydrolase